MNIEFLPEGDSAEKASEDITASVQITDISPAEHSRKVLSAVIALSCFILCSVSLLLHTAAASDIIEYIWNDGHARLISAVIPGAEVHYPKIPPVKDDIPPQDSSDSDTKQSGNSTPIAEYMSADLSTAAVGAIDISNETSYNPDINALYSRERPVSALSKQDVQNAPLVLIYHTHGTEAYAESAANAFRSYDISENVVSVGSTITDVLTEAGITAVHLEEMFDSENWSAAYDMSTAAVRETLKKYPSIKYIFDVHRDCIGNDEVGYIRSLAEYGNFETAQLMFVCGTDQGGSRHVTWEQNLTFALQLQNRLWNMSKNLMRPVDLRSASFYQDTGNGALLAEFGTCANSLIEAKRSAVLFASALADYIYGEECGLDCPKLIEKYCR